MPSQHIAIHGHDIAYRTLGRGPACLVLLHGMAGSSATWRHVMPQLARDFTVVAPDMLGHGQSAKPRTDYSLGAHATCVRDLLLALGLGRATIVGQSWGGGVAMQLACASHSPIAKAESFQPRVQAFYVVTSGERDAKIQTAVRILSERRLADAKFPVGVIFWDDLMEDLTSSRTDFQKHYPQIHLDASPIDAQRKVEADRDQLLRWAKEQETLHKRFLQQGRKMGAVVSANRTMWFEKARIAAESCAAAYRSAGDELAALRWEQVAKSTRP
jgi:pimeloyl-ACP methyl ester carboxylesterase